MPRIVAIEAKLKGRLKNKIIALLNEYIIVLVWSYADMQGLIMDIIGHRLPLRSE